MLGDFSGRSSRNLRDTLSGRKPKGVDCDNLDDVLQRLNVLLELRGTSESTDVRFYSMADFHPDKLVERAASVATTYDLRMKLLNPGTFPGAAQTLTALLKPAATPAGPEKMRNPVASPKESNEETLQRLLGRAPQRTRRADFVQEKVEELIRQSLTTEVTSSLEPELKELLPAVDLFLGHQLNGLLHHPDFQSLEAAWRSIDFLVRNLDTDEMLGVYLLDVSFEELAEELNSTNDLSFTAPYKWLVEDTVGQRGGLPWAVVLGDYYFSPPDPEHNELLIRLARLCAAGKTVFLAGAAPSVLSLAEQRGKPESWLELRTMPEASSIGLLFPRFLLRLPYGSKTDPIDAFEFEETPEGSRSEHYLWGNAAFLAGCLLGQSFSNYGWDFSPGMIDQCEGRPVHTFRDGGETHMTPCGELWLSDATVERLERVGIMALQSIQNRDAVRLPRFHSLASPLTALRGRWTG